MKEKISSNIRLVRKRVKLGEKTHCIYDNIINVWNTYNSSSFKHKIIQVISFKKLPFLLSEYSKLNLYINTVSRNDNNTRKNNIHTLPINRTCRRRNKTDYKYLKKKRLNGHPKGFNTKSD